jgi:hypothetical protein
MLGKILHIDIAKTKKSRGFFMGCRALPAPRRAPELLGNALNGTGLLFRELTAKKCVYIATHKNRR